MKTEDSNEKAETKEGNGSKNNNKEGNNIMENNPVQLIGKGNIMNTNNGENNNQSSPIAEQIAQKVQDTVSKTNALTANNWIGIGRIIKEHIDNVPARPIRVNLFKELEQHKDCCLKESQIRNYYAVFTLWQQLGGHEGAPNVSFSHFILVLPSRVPDLEKRKHLLHAQANNLTASQFKEFLEKIYKPNSKLTKFLKRYFSKINEMASDINCKDKIRSSFELKSLLSHFVSQVIANRLINPEDIPEEINKILAQLNFEKGLCNEAQSN